MIYLNVDAPRAVLRSRDKWQAAQSTVVYLSKLPLCFGAIFVILASVSLHFQPRNAFKAR